ncbi:hypothetical protein HK102_010234 [Quaeritorhiza haematococci]|nr:hypothetical protein HK102_010234 [Quaeritorhiza haematococci]
MRRGHIDSEDEVTPSTPAETFLSSATSSQRSSLESMASSLDSLSPGETSVSEDSCEDRTYDTQLSENPASSDSDATYVATPRSRGRSKFFFKTSSGSSGSGSGGTSWWNYGRRRSTSKTPATSVRARSPSLSSVSSTTTVLPSESERCDAQNGSIDRQHQHRTFLNKVVREPLRSAWSSRLSRRGTKKEAFPPPSDSDVGAYSSSSSSSFLAAPRNHTSSIRGKSPRGGIRKNKLPRTLRRFLIWIFLLTFTNYRYWSGRPQVPLACNLISLWCPQYPIQGYIGDGYEGVLESFKANFKDGWEVGASFAAYVDDEPVVELYGGFHDTKYNRHYTPDSLTLIFSSSKVVEGIVATYLVDKGLLSFEDKISDFWPEFAQGNKENVTVRCLLGHRAGVTYLNRQPSLTEIADLDQLAALLAAQPHNFNGSEVQGYHAVTRGWYLNELVRRVDPQKRTLGQIIRQEIMPALNIEYYLGLPREQEPRLTPLNGYPAIRTIAKIIMPTVVKEEPVSPVFKKVLFQRKSVSHKAIAGSTPRQLRIWPHTHNRREIWAAEGPSYGGITNARSMVRLANLMVNEGATDGIRLISAETVRRALVPLPTTLDAVVARNITFATGGWGLHMKIPSIPELEWIGWGGAGGSMAFWNPEHRIAFSYVMNSMAFTTMGDRRSWRIVRALVDAALAKKKGAATVPGEAGVVGSSMPTMEIDNPHHHDVSAGAMGNGAEASVFPSPPPAKSSSVSHSRKRGMRTCSAPKDGSPGGGVFAQPGQCRRAMKVVNEVVGD